MAAVDKKPGAKKKYQTHLEEKSEQALIAARDRLNRPQHRLRSQLLTWEIVNKLRERAAAGEPQ